MDSSSFSGTPVCYKYQNIHCLRSYTVKNLRSKCGVNLKRMRSEWFVIDLIPPSMKSTPRGSLFRLLIKKNSSE
jgi:hypothetical protein